MKIAVLGYGVEGKSVEQYFLKKGAEVQVIPEIYGEELTKFNSADYDEVFRSPAVRPVQKWNSVTKYFFEHCPVPIIGVTGTKGKGTTCTMIRDILAKLGKKVHLLGNIGVPALDALDEIEPEDVVVYEMSSFQLWDMECSPAVAVILRIEADHLDVHSDFEEYFAAKSNIVKFQKAEDTVIFYGANEKSRQMAELSAGQKVEYGLEVLEGLPEKKELDLILEALKVPGAHNKENAMAAILAVSSFMGQSLAEFLQMYGQAVGRALGEFKTLPHHIELVRELEGVAYYDDSYSTALPSLEVALQAFKEPLVLIAGGKHKGFDLSPIVEVILAQKNLAGVVLIGETGLLLYNLLENRGYEKMEWRESLRGAVYTARDLAHAAKETSGAERAVVLMSPAASSFDLFDSYKQRGEIFQLCVRKLK